MRLTGLRRLSVLGAAGALCLVVLLAVVGALSPRWINGTPVKARVAAHLSQLLGGKVEFGRIDLSWLPIPRAVLREVKASVPGKWSGSARSVAVYPGVLPLLRGRLLPARIRLEYPELRADLAALAGKAPKEPLTLADAREKTAALLAAMSARAPGLVVETDKGRVALFRGPDHLVALGNVEARLTMPPGSLRADVRCAWGAGGTLSLSGAIDARTLDGRAEFAFARLDAAALARILSPSARIALEGSDVDAAGSIETAGLRSVRAALRGSAPSVALRRGERTYSARDVRFRGSVDAGQGTVAATLSELAVGSPPLRASGTLTASARRAALSLDARDTHVAAARDALLFFSGDAAPVRDAFSRIEGGALPSVTVAAAGRGIFDPAAIDNLTLVARLRDGTVRVREAELLFTDVAADVAVRRGVLSAGRIAARLGRSTVRDGTLSMGLSGAHAPFRAALPVDADIADLLPIVSRVAGYGVLSRALSAVEVAQGRAAGRLFLGDRLDAIRATADVADVRLFARVRTLPGPIEVASGKVRIDRGKISWSGVAARLLDASLLASGSLAGYDTGPRTLDATFSGTLGPDAVREAAKAARLSPVLAMRSPISVASARLASGADNALSAKATFAVAGGPEISVDLRRRPGELDVRAFSIRDDESRASGSLALSASELGFTFAGRLTGGTVNRLFVDGRFPAGRVEGDFAARVPARHPARATATGRLEAAGIRIPELLGPLAIEKLSVEAAGNRIAVKPSELAWGTTRFTLAGSAEASEGGLRVDMDVGAGAVDWAAFRGAVKPLGPDTGRPHLPKVTGVVRVAAASVADGPRTWKPFRADVALDPDAIRVSIRQAGLCGIEARGEATIAPGETAVDIRASAAGNDVGPLLSCLRGEHVRMTGRYELTVRVAGRGTDETLPRALSGSVTFRSTGGRIYKATLLSKILAVLNVTQILFGKFPDIAHEGFAYNTLSIPGDVKEGKLVLREATLDAASANLSGEGAYDFTADRLDVVILASPLKTVDAVLRRIPVVGYILGGSLVSVPFRVTGNPDDPAVSVLPPAEVGKGILGVVERALKAPIKLIAPILPRETAK